MSEITDIDIDAVLIREDWAAEELWTRQTESDLIPPFALEELLSAARMEIEGDAVRPEAERGLFLAAQRILAEREAELRVMVEQPLTRCFVPDDLWIMLRELVKKRLRFPGDPLVFWLSGGIRSGKSFQFAGMTVCHWLYYRAKRRGNERKGCGIFAACTKIDKSPALQQQPMKYFMPVESAGGQKGSIRSGTDTKLKFSGGKFTDDRFSQFQTVEIETGEQYMSGGTCQFGAETQVEGDDTHVMQGIEVTMAWLDEGKNTALLKTLRERAASGAVPTRERWHRELMQQLLTKLNKAGTPEFVRPTPYEIGQLMLGVIVNSYTPKEGWNAMAGLLLTGAEYPDEFKREAPELVGKPGCKDARVPILAFPADPHCLVGFLHTSQNKAVYSYPSLSRMYADKSEDEIRKSLYGHVTRSDETLYVHFKRERHMVTWADLPRDATLYEVVDPAGAKPWVVVWYLVDPAGRVWVAQEWPCPGWKIEGFDPGPWAVPTESDKLNGDPGPAQKMRLAWSRAHYIRQLWEGRQRLVAKMKETGAEWKGAMLRDENKRPLEALRWERGWMQPGPFAMPVRSIMDSRFAGAPTESKGVHTTVLEAMYDEEHAVAFDPAAGVSLSEGDTMINTALSTEVLGLPGLLVNEECENTLFMFRTYTLPPHRETTSAKDEACKDFRDPTAYLLLSGAEYINPNAGPRCVGGGSY